MSAVRKRYFVSQGELFKLWAEVEQVRDTEKRDEFRASFKAIMKDAQEVKLVVTPKKETV